MNEGEPRNSTVWTYDVDGRVVRQVWPDGGVTQFEYEDGGRRYIVTHPNGDMAIGEPTNGPGSNT